MNDDHGIQAALAFYADPETYRSPTTGWNAQYDPEPSPIEKDKGERARKVVQSQRAEKAREIGVPNTGQSRPDGSEFTQADVDEARKE